MCVVHVLRPFPFNQMAFELSEFWSDSCLSKKKKKKLAFLLDVSHIVNTIANGASIGSAMPIPYVVNPRKGFGLTLCQKKTKHWYLFINKANIPWVEMKWKFDLLWIVTRSQRKSKTEPNIRENYKEIIVIECATLKFMRALHPDLLEKNRHSIHFVVFMHYKLQRYWCSLCLRKHQMKSRLIFQSTGILNLLSN